MVIAVAIPKNCLELATESLGGQWTNLAEFEDILMMRPQFKNVLGTMGDAGIPFNAIGFMHTNGTKHMWAVSNRYDALGEMFERNWQVDLDSFDVCHRKMLEMIDYSLRDVSNDMVTQQYAKLATGPSFCPNQLEYGKRYKLSQMLLS